MKRLSLILIVLTAFLGSKGFAQNPTFDWAFNVEDQNAPSGYVTNGHDLASFGEFVYVAGTFAGTVDFDPGPGTAELTSFGGFDIFIQKLDTNGNFIWVKQFGGPSADGMTIVSPPFNGVPEPLGLSLNVTTNGDLILAGTFTDSIDCDPDPNSSFWIIGARACAVVKVSDDGQMIWAKTSASANSNVYSSDIDTEGNIYLAGNFAFSLPVDFNPSPVDEHYLESEAFDIFVQKLTPDGELDWVLQFSNAEIDYGVFVETDIQGNVVLVGSFRDSIDSDPGPGEYFLEEQSSSGTATFICKLSGDGEFMWGGVIQSGSGRGHDRLTVDGSANIYLTQIFSQTIDVDPTENVTIVSSTAPSSSAFVCKLSPAGELIWSTVLSGVSGSNGNEILPSTAVVSGSTLLIGGWFSGTVNFNPSSPSAVHVGELDGFVLRLDTSGSFSWVHTFSTEHLEVRSLELSGNSVYGTGYSSGGVGDCDPTIGVQSLGEDMFVFKWIDSFLVSSSAIQKTDYLGVLVYPNPSAGPIYIEFEEPSSFEVNVYSGLGQLCYSRTYESTISESIQLGDVPGLYHVVVSYAGSTESFKILKS